MHTISPTQKLNLGRAVIIKGRLNDIRLKLEVALSTFQSSLTMDLVALDDAFEVENEEEIQRIWNEIGEDISENYSDSNVIDDGSLMINE